VIAHPTDGEKNAKLSTQQPYRVHLLGGWHFNALKMLAARVPDQTVRRVSTLR
jgi:hypothetical protein